MAPGGVIGRTSCLPRTALVPYELGEERTKWLYQSAERRICFPQ